MRSDQSDQVASTGRDSRAPSKSSETQFCRTGLSNCAPLGLILAVAALLTTTLLVMPRTTLAEPGKPAAGWSLLPVPETFRDVPKGNLAPVDGNSWYRCLVQVPSGWKDAKLRLFVEALDDARAAYVNGTKVGATGTFPPQFRSGLGEQGRYLVAGDLIKAGELNTIAIRVHQNDPRPNFNTAPPVLLNEDSKEAIRMEGQWQYRPGDDATFAKATAADFGIEATKALGDEALKLGVYFKVDKVDDVERYVSKRKGDSDPVAPKIAEQHFVTPNDLKFQLAVGDPDIAQALFMSFDARGRMWLIEYRQYPEIAGLKMVSQDKFLRRVYDKVPPPPPHHDKGRDRISIHEDTDGDGFYDKHAVFVDGLNLATSVAVGRGGVFVTNPPYLLFYPDKNGDDVPDGDPEVLLEGFGLEDSHSVANSLRFGPDGWLYGAQGSTVSGKVKRFGTKDPTVDSMGQLIWRYHPERKLYEIFAEGGGNTFGVEIDAQGRIFSGHNGGDTRGFHYVQGGYLQKGFGKHGALSNPFAFGYFAQMKHHSVARFTHNFIIYEGNELPDAYRGRLYGVEPLQGQVVMSEIMPFKASFETRDLSRVVKTDDAWFRPVDIKAGPDGSIYVADLYEQRIDHSSHYAGRIDRTNGRVYRLTSKAGLKQPSVNYTKATEAELIAALDSLNKWQRQAALVVIGDRKSASMIPKLRDRLKTLTGQAALESLWALHLSGGLTDEVAELLLKHEDQFVRAWTVRLLCDDYSVEPQIARALAEVAGHESYLSVRGQLASSAKRLPAKDALPIIRNLLKYDEDATDIFQPLLIWWAIEAKATGEGRDLILSAVLNDKDVWNRPLVKEHLTERLMKRYAISGTREELMAAAKLLKQAPNKESTDKLLKGFEEAYKGRSLSGIPSDLVDAIAASGGGSTVLKLRQGNADAMKIAGAAVVNAKHAKAERLDFLRVFGEIRRSEFIPVLLDVVTKEQDQDLLAAALTALQAFDDLRIGQQVVPRLKQIPGDARLVAETLLASRKVWATELLQAVDDGSLKPADVSDAALRKITLHDDAKIKTLVSKHWGSIAGATSDDMKKEIARLMDLLGQGSGNPYKGKQLFREHCGKCHKLFDEGGQIGPDLTSFKRDNLERVLTNVVNPSLEIREGFENYIIETTDGRVVNGFLADKDNQVVVLRGIDGQNLIFRRDEIEEMHVTPKSVMPEGTLSKLNEQQLRDLFAYVRATQPVN